LNTIAANVGMNYSLPTKQNQQKNTSSESGLEVAGSEGINNFG
jgi:hypothetical protein